jgi:hypothetical protein
VIPPVLSETDRLDFLQIPPQLQDCLQQLIEKKSISEARPEERVKLIEAFFRKGFNYSRKVEVPRGKNPMLWFLETKKAGHCEFFASAAALLLRSSGIPARLVTGFVVNEKNPFGEYFMVRNGDAHAWVEAWLPNRGWQIVEVTPDDGIPAFKGGNYFSHGLDWFLSRIQHFFLELRQRGIVVLIEYMMMVLPFLLVCLFCSFILYLWYRRGKKMYEQTAASLVLSAQTQELIELRKIMDEKLLRQKMVRTSVESLHSFATKLDEKQYVKEAKWYRDYALLLYCSQRSEEQFRQLRFDLDNLDSKDNNA